MKTLTALFALFILSACIDYSEGERTGVLIKFSHKGVACKTWEGDVNLGGMVSGENGAVPNVWSFSVDSEHPEDLRWVPILQDAASTGKRVRIGYHQELATGPCRSETSYFVKSVTVLN